MTCALSIQNIHKSFSGHPVLKGINLTLNTGEVLGLMGENGAGKSTLVKIISGELGAEMGQINIFGQKITPNPRLVAKLGVGVVHQHFLLADDLTGLENIVLGNEKTLGRISWKERKKEVIELQKKSELSAPLEIKTKFLSVGDRQRIEILKVLYQRAKIILFDEPTAVLTPQETTAFFNLVRVLASQGYAVIVITHKIHEIYEITHRVAVMRHGTIQLNEVTKETEENTLVRAMVGASVVACKNDIQLSETAPVVLKLEKAGCRAKEEFGRSALQDCSFEIKAGEIFGVAGVDGSGQDLLVAGVIGLTSFTGGSACYLDSDLNKITLDARIKKGMRWTPIDRYEQGIFAGLSLWENASFGRKAFATKKIFGLHFLKRRFLKNIAAKIIHACHVEPKVELDSISSYSGGNQQKFSLGLLTNTIDDIDYDKNIRLILCCHPTRGVDVYSSQILRNRLLECARKNIAILLVSADLDELLALCPRVGVLSGGNYMGTVTTRENGAREKIGSLMAGNF